jgi:peptide/nickel transport system substrate-binding protein
MALLTSIQSVASLRAQTIERITVGETSDADQLNPFTNFSATGSYLNEYLFQSLIRTDKQTGAFVPLLAEALPTISDDMLSYTYSLNPLAKFNNGKKVTARDVVFSLKMQRNPFVNNSQKRSHYEAITAVLALDEHVVTFQVARPNSQALRITGEFAILSEEFFDPEKVLDAISLADELLGDKMSMDKLQALKAVAERINVFGSSFPAFNPDPTTGSYVLLNWKRGSEIVLAANKRFWGKKLPTIPNDFFKQNVAEIRFEITTDEAVLRKGLFDNRYDLVSSTPYGLFSTLSEIPAVAKNYKFLSPPGPSYEYIGMNMRAKARQHNPALEDLAVRKALTMLVHVDLLTVEVCSGLGTRIASDCPASRPDYRSNFPLIGLDIAKAKATLDQAGWKDSDGNDLRDKNIAGDDVQMVLECIYNENRPERKKIAEHLQANAREAGILVTLTELPWKDYLTRLKSGDFDLYIGAWASDPNEDSYRQIWHSKSWGKGSNFVGFGNEATDRLIVQYDETIAPDKQKAICQEIQKAIYDQQPYIFLWTNNNCLVLNQRFAKAAIYDLRPGFWISAWE